LHGVASLNENDATWNPLNRWNVRNIAIASIVAALNAALLGVFAPISYGPLQFRVSLIIQPALVILFAYPAASGLILSGFLMNYFFGYGLTDAIVGSSLGVLEWVIMIELVKKLGRHDWLFQVSCALFSLLTGAWIGEYLAWIAGVPWEITFVSVTASTLIAFNLFGYTFFKAITASSAIKKEVPTLKSEKKELKD